MTGEAGAPAGGASPLVDCYEQLREEVISGARGGSLGLALFLRGGMTAWMRACSTWMPKPAPLTRSRGGATLPVDLRGQMATLLADMALSTTREATS